MDHSQTRTLLTGQTAVSVNARMDYLSYFNIISVKIVHFLRPATTFMAEYTFRRQIAFTDEIFFHENTFDEGKPNSGNYREVG